MYPPIATVLVCILLPVFLPGQNAPSPPPDLTADSTLSKEARIFWGQDIYLVRLSGQIKDQNDSIVRKAKLKWWHAIKKDSAILKERKAEFNGNFTIAIDTDTSLFPIMIEKEGYANVLLEVGLKQLSTSGFFKPLDNGQMLVLDTIHQLTMPRLALDSSSTLLAGSGMLHIFPAPYFTVDLQECSRIKKDKIYFLKKTPADTVIYENEKVLWGDSLAEVSGRWFKLDYVEVDSAFIPGAKKEGYFFGSSRKYYMDRKYPAICYLKKDTLALKDAPPGWDGRAEEEGITGQEKALLKLAANSSYPVYRSRWLAEEEKNVVQLKVRQGEEAIWAYIDAKACTFGEDMEDGPKEEERLISSPAENR